jgi:hypothetical protein
MLPGNVSRSSPAVFAREDDVFAPAPQLSFSTLPDMCRDDRGRKRHVQLAAGRGQRHRLRPRVNFSPGAWT